MLEVLKNLWETSGFAQFFLDPDGWKSGIMILIAFALLYMAIKKQFEPLLLLPIAFGMLLTNLPWPGSKMSKSFAAHKALAKRTRCCCPPESSLKDFFAKDSIPSFCIFSKAIFLSVFV